MEREAPSNPEFGMTPNEPSNLADAGNRAIDVHALRFWSLERTAVNDSYLLGLATESHGKRVFRIGALDILRLAQVVLEDREQPRPDTPVQ